jgi:hypothetical protein
MLRRLWRRLRCALFHRFRWVTRPVPDLGDGVRFRTFCDACRTDWPGRSL